MKLWIPLFAASLLMFSCAKNSADKNNSQPETRTDEPDNSFLKIFPTRDGEGLHVYTPKEDSIVVQDKFTGKTIDRSLYHFLTFNGENLSHLDTFYHYHACYKFNLGNTKTGLIIRRPSQYSETAIDLYTWDNATGKITNVINLADSFGDEGWYFVQDGWIKDINNDGITDVVIRRKDSDTDLDNPEEGTTLTDSLFTYIGDGKTFRKTDYKLNANAYRLKYWDGK